jgi:hypothetical protein
MSLDKQLTRIGEGKILKVAIVGCGGMGYIHEDCE